MRALECTEDGHFDGMKMLNALNGFLMLLDMNGNVLYLSEHVTHYLKYLPVSMRAR